MQQSWKMLFGSSEEKDKWWSKMSQIQEILLFQAICVRGQKFSLGTPSTSNTKHQLLLNSQLISLVDWLIG
jgi:hypothetical protein